MPTDSPTLIDPGTHLRPVADAGDGAGDADAGNRDAWVRDDGDRERLPPAGVYRVVGRSDDAVTLLAVGDADGVRVHSGQIHRVSRERLRDFERVRAPEPPGLLVAFGRRLSSLVGLR
ncbi:hypothetical protein RYH80_01025 [Halobaculum sp. MBLA0147]|uniref:hypothetical protein n=1 Tax=Halobaculum sp. MBLA0147 TaxID=3079934 RepID=UPI003523DCD5